MGIQERRQEREIAGFVYSVVPLQTSFGLRVLDRFKNVIAPLLSAAVVARGGLEQAAAVAMKALPSSLSAEDVEFFQRSFADTSSYKDGGRSVPMTTEIQDLHFAGRYMELFDWLTFCMEVNFKGFFDELKRRAGAAMSKAKAAIGSESTEMMGSSSVS